MSYEPLHHKYRPQTFADLVGQDAIATTLTNAIRTSKIAPAYLFTGPRGTGKTSSARILAKSLNCLKNDKPTEQPCGVCEVCKAIANGSALDVIEIDAASNTGVDHIRELIERAQFAPVQCRYKVYVIDECLTGDSLVQTSEGLIRIDDPNIKGKKVLSYNESSATWEFKKVVRWLDQGERQTVVIKTTNGEIRCTGNHLIRTEQGWIAAKDVKEGAKILSPVNAAAASSFTNLARMDAPGDLLEDTSSKAIHTGKKHTTCSISIQPAIPNSKMSLTLLNPTGKENSSLWIGSIASPQKDLLGGFVMMAHLASVQKELQQSNFIQKDSLPKKIKSLPIGLQQWAIRQKGFTAEVTETRRTTTSAWAQTPLENGWQTSSSIQFPQWITSLEIVESVTLGGVERVYDIEVQDNHNFVANGLCLHNCHMLSVSAFNALLKTLEEPPARVVFVLATTDPQRVLPTIISRCQRFDYRRIPLDAMVAHLSAIASKENINITHSAVQLVAQVAQGGLRDAESLLDQLSLLSGQVTVERVWDLVGSCSEPDLMALLQAIAQNNPEVVLDCARTIMDRGREPLTVLQNLAGFYRDLLIAKTAPNRNDLVAVTPPTWKALCEEAKSWDVSTILTGQQHLAKSEVQIKNTTQPRLWLEVTMLGLLPAANSNPLSAFSGQPIVSPPHKGIQRQTGQAQGTAPTVDANSKDIAKQQQRITSDGISQTQQTPPEQAASAAENSQPPVQQENPQPIANQGDRTSGSITEQALAEVEGSPSTSEPLSPANSASETPREQVWQQVLANLQPISTRELLRQLCHLIEFDGAVARIGITSQPWYKKAQAHLPNIKAAFEETFKRKIHVSLELTTPTKTKTTPVNKPRSPGTATATGTSPQVTEPVKSNLAPTSSSPHQSQAGMTAGGATASKVSESPKLGVAAYTPTNTADWEEDEVAITAQRLADFFKGEVVRLQDDPAFPQPIETNSLPPQTDSGWYDADAEGEADIDF